MTRTPPALPSRPPGWRPGRCCCGRRPGLAVVGCARRDQAPADAYRARVTIDSEPVSVGRFLTLEQVAGELAVSRAQVYAVVRDKTLLALKVGGRGKWRVERSELESYVARLYEEALARPAVRVDEDEEDEDQVAAAD